MIAKIVDNHWIYLDQVTQGSEDAVVHHFSVRHPKAYFMDLGQDWDGWYRRYNVSKQRLALPFLNELKICCDKNNIPLDIHDLRDPVPLPSEDKIHKDMLDGVVLEDYQINAVRATLNEEIGLISSMTGSGKTEMMCAITKLYDCPTILITEQRVVLDQIVERLHIRGVVKDDDIGMFCSGRMPDGQQIIVGSVQSVSTPTKPKYSDVKMWEKQALKLMLDLIEKEDREELNHILPSVLVEALINNPAGIEKLTGKYTQLAIEHFKHKKFNKMLQWYRTRFDHSRDIQAEIKNAQLLLIDEADLATSVQYNTLCRLFNGRRRYGFSGTPFDKSKPVQNLFLRENLGNVIHEVPRQEVQDRGRIIPVKPIFIAVGTDGDRHDLRTYDIAMSEEIINNDKFKNMVVKINSALSKEHNLILVDTSPIESLGLSLEKMIPNSKFLYNKSPMSERRKYVKMFEKGELQCLIGGKIFKRGLDLKGGVDNLIIIGGGKQWSNIHQMIGRGVRINSRGWARVFCFFFLNNKYLYGHSRENLKAVVDLGYPTIVSINGKQVDASKFIHSRFRLPK